MDRNSKAVSYLVLILACFPAPGQPALDEASVRKHNETMLAQLQSLAPDSMVRAFIQVVGSVSLTSVHELSQRLALPSIQLFVTSPLGEEPNRGPLLGESGEWRGQTGERWMRTVCKLRMAAQDRWNEDIPENSILLRNWEMIAPVDAVRKVINEYGSTAYVGYERVENVESYRRTAQENDELDVRFVAADYPVPVGCDSYAHRLKGWSRPGSPDAKVVLTYLSADTPNQPVRLALEIPASASIREVASLSEKYDIADMLLKGYAPGVRLNSVAPAFVLRFSAAAPPQRTQLDRADCILRVMWQSDPPPSLGARQIDIKLWQLTATAELSASEAKRLASDLPAPLTKVYLVQAVPTAALNKTRQEATADILRPWPTGDFAKIPPGCEQYITHIPPPKT
jgi:hypothetical protein